MESLKFYNPQHSLKLFKNLILRIIVIFLNLCMHINYMYTYAFFYCKIFIILNSLRYMRKTASAANNELISTEDKEQYSNGNVIAYLKKEEMQMFLKAKVLIRQQLVALGMALPNENISQTKIVKTLLLNYCQEKKIA